MIVGRTACGLESSRALSERRCLRRPNSLALPERDLPARPVGGYEDDAPPFRDRSSRYARWLDCATPGLRKIEGIVIGIGPEGAGFEDAFEAEAEASLLGWPLPLVVLLRAVDGSSVGGCSSNC